MKKALPAFLLILFLFNAVGYYALFFFIRQQTRESVVSEIWSSSFDARDVKKIKYSSAEIQWTGTGEFRYHNELYDLVSEAKAGDGSILLYCLSDKKEDKLMTGLDEQIKGSAAPASDPPAKLVIKLTLPDFTIVDRLNISPGMSGSSMIYFESSASIILFTPARTSPPPRLA